MLLLLLNFASADCEHVLTPHRAELNVSPTPVLLVEDFRMPWSQDDIPVRLYTSDGQAVPLEAGESYCTLGRTVTYAFTPVEPLVAGAEYSLDIDNESSNTPDRTPVRVSAGIETPPTEVPIVTIGMRNPQPGEPQTGLEEDEFVWRLEQDFPSLYAEYQVADATGQIHVFAATSWSWIEIGSNYCVERWPSVSDDTVLFLRARYLNSSGQTGPWSAWTPSENAPSTLALPADDATIDCGVPPEPPTVGTPTGGCTATPGSPAILLLLAPLLGLRRRRR